MLQLREYDRYIGKEDRPKVERKPASARRAEVIARWKIRVWQPAWLFIRRRLDFINRLPFSVLFVIYLLVLFTAILFANQIRAAKFNNAIIEAYPELVKGTVDGKGNVIQISPIDKILEEFNARSSAMGFLVFGLTVGMFLKYVWGNTNSRKPQIVQRY